MPKRLAAVLLAACCTISTAATQPAGGPAADLYHAIRTNNPARLKALVQTAADANARNEAGDTPLMISAAVGSIDAMRFLLDKGADVNGQNAFGSTALIWSATDLAKVRLLVDRGANVSMAGKTGRTAAFVAAMSERSAPIVRLLVSKGADLKATDAFQNTMLSAATVGNDLETIRLVLDAGVDVNAAGVTGVTPLLNSSHHANLAAVQLLLSKGARTNAVAAVPALFPAGDPKSGPVALTAITPLMVAAAAGTPDLVKTLLDAGADVNAKDGRNMTPLMFAVAKNHQDPAIIRLLVDRGADLALQSNVGETAADWARKVGAPAGLEILKVRKAQAQDMAAATSASAVIDVKTAAERSMLLLETSSRKFFETSGCVSCHHQNITDFAAAEARAKGLKVSADAMMERMKMLGAAPPPQGLYERMDIGVPEIFASTLAALAALDVPANPATDALVANIAATQASDGSWHIAGGVNERPPAEEGGITRAALAIRSLKVYGPPGRAEEMRARIAQARDWLLAQTAVTSDDRNMQLLGAHWAGADAAALKRLAAPILAAQQADGGWRQRETLSSDAYATGQSLYVLAKTGALAPSDAAYQKGVKLLLATQAPNGSWRVASRAPKFQAYFNSGFPYAGDQWISAWATGWATMALAQALPASAARPVSDQ